MEEGLERFLDAQRHVYDTALEEIKGGRKQSHWMWYIFPQLRGLGHSETAWHYGIKDGGEAKAYLGHPVLGARLEEISAALLSLDTDDAESIFGWIDALKLRSSMTLFDWAEQDGVYARVLEKFYDGQRDTETLKRLV